MKINVADLFCGGGGETTGIVQAARQAGLKIDLAAVNHWRVAIETHHMNYPDARAYCQDLATLNPLDVFGARDKVDLLWASPECTHHSNARGGRPCSEQGRASAWLILKWLSELYVRRVILENVPEFLNWGPLGADGKPLASKKGEMFRAFVSALESMGYTVEWRLLCAADYGDPTTRTRLFVQAARGGARILWPEPTHAKVPGLFAREPWRAAREIIDWSIQGQSIFDRKKPLAPATMQRIAAGIRRYWGEWAEPFLTAIDHTGSGIPRAYTLDDPLRTITTENRFALVEPFLVPHYGEREGQEPRTHAIGEPCPTVPASGGGSSPW
ncbi:MAG: DNA cytosine methyltransferase [Chloroflexi bacterium]|nr:DNA cytosine methyltransferase [Chloroflexota bacterium]